MVKVVERRGQEVATGAIPGFELAVEGCLDEGRLFRGTAGDSCRIAGGFDRGLFKAPGVLFSNVIWTPEHGDGCCHQ